MAERDCKVFYFALCGFSEAIEKVKRAAKKLKINLQVFVDETLEPSEKAFADDGSVFNSTQQRLLAKSIALEKGLELEKKCPLGYGDCEAMVVFFSNCPNNSLPILFKSNDDFRAIFPRA